MIYYLNLIIILHLLALVLVSTIETIEDQHHNIFIFKKKDDLWYDGEEKEETLLVFKIYYRILSISMYEWKDKAKAEGDW